MTSFGLMSRRPRYEVIDVTDECMLIRDLSPWFSYPTVTSAAEIVVAELAPLLGKRRLEYVDSSGNKAEIVIKRGRFAGFATSRIR